MRFIFLLFYIFALDLVSNFLGLVSITVCHNVNCKSHCEESSTAKVRTQEGARQTKEKSGTYVETRYYALCPFGLTCQQLAWFGDVGTSCECQYTIFLEYIALQAFFKSLHLGKPRLLSMYILVLCCTIRRGLDVLSSTKKLHNSNYAFVFFMQERGQVSMMKTSRTRVSYPLRPLRKSTKR